MKPRQLGLDPISEIELDSMKYIIYCVGQAIGIDEDLNLCNGDVKETKEYSNLIFTRIIQPSMEIETDLNREMADHLLQGMNIMNPFLGPNAFKTWTFKLFEVNCPSKFSTKFFDLLLGTFFHGMFGNIFIRPVFSTLMITNIYLANKWEKHVLIIWRRHIW